MSDFVYPMEIETNIALRRIAVEENYFDEVKRLDAWFKDNDVLIEQTPEGTVWKLTGAVA